MAVTMSPANFPSLRFGSIPANIITFVACVLVANGNNALNLKGNKDIYSTYKPIADKIIRYLTAGTGRGLGYDRLAYLTDTFGPRLTGSKSLNDTSDYLVRTLKKEGFDAYTEEAIVPGWVRGEECAFLEAPRRQKIAITGLGFTIATPADGISAEAVVVTSFDDLAKLGKDGIQGKIVVYNEPWEGYGITSDYRYSGASEAAKFGAVATLIRSAASFSIYSPHTGMQGYSDGVPQIPTACITEEDARMLHRMYKRGQALRLWLKILSHPTDDVITRNTIGEIKGSLYPNEIVLISGHLDSWDIGWGAMDDGGGVIISWLALSVIKALGLKPKRTVRAVFWTGEEQGHVGSRYYYNQHKKWANETFVFVMESDMGAFKPHGLNFSGNAAATAKMEQIVRLLAPINADRLFPCDDGGDVDYWMKNDGVPGGVLEPTDREDYYFMFHHSHGDNVKIFKPEELDYAATLWTVVAYVVADLGDKL